MGQLSWDRIIYRCHCSFVELFSHLAGLTQIHAKSVFSIILANTIHTNLVIPSDPTPLDSLSGLRLFQQLSMPRIAGSTRSWEADAEGSPSAGTSAADTPVPDLRPPEPGGVRFPSLTPLSADLPSAAQDTDEPASRTQLRHCHGHSRAPRSCQGLPCSPDTAGDPPPRHALGTPLPCLDPSFPRCSWPPLAAQATCSRPGARVTAPADGQRWP